MQGARDRFVRMEARRPSLVEEFADHRRFEYRLAVDEQQGRLAERRDLQEPLRLAGEIDVTPFEGNGLLGEDNGGALDIGTQRMFGARLAAVAETGRSSFDGSDVRHTSEPVFPRQLSG